MPCTRCSYCAQDFPSCGKLFQHLRETGHDKFFDISQSDDGSSAGDNSATQLLPQTLLWVAYMPKSIALHLIQVMQPSRLSLVNS